MRNLSSALTLLAVLLVSNLTAQSIGVRFNTEFACEQLTRSACGVGMYFNTHNAPCRFELIVSCDYNKNQQEYPNERGCVSVGFHSTYTRISGAVGTQYRFEISPKILVKTGIVGFYELAQISEIGSPSNWISGHSKYLTGSALIATFRYKSILHSDFNLDCFLFPQYGFIVSGARDPEVFNHPVYFHGFKMNVQVGISYSVD